MPVECQTQGDDTLLGHHPGLQGGVNGGKVEDNEAHQPAMRRGKASVEKEWHWWVRICSTILN